MPGRFRVRAGLFVLEGGRRPAAQPFGGVNPLPAAGVQQ